MAYVDISKKLFLFSCYYQSWNCEYVLTSCFDYFAYASDWQMERAKGEWNIPRPAVGGVHNWNGCTIRFSVLYFKLLEINSHTFGECTHWPNKKFWIYVWTKLELYNFQENASGEMSRDICYDLTGFFTLRIASSLVFYKPHPPPLRNSRWNQCYFRKKKWLFLSFFLPSFYN